MSHVSKTYCAYLRYNILFLHKYICIRVLTLLSLVCSTEEEYRDLTEEHKALLSLVCLTEKDH